MVYKVSLSLPLGIFQLFFSSFPVYVTDNATSRYPKNRSDQHYSSYNVISQKQQHFVYVDVFYNVPEAFDHILNGFFAISVIAKTLNTGSSVS